MTGPAHQLVTIEKPIYGGNFLARIDGKAVFVPLALPGEQVQVRIVNEKKSYAEAEIEALVAAAPERIQPACPHFSVCGGCHYQHAPYQSQLDLKQFILRETFERAGLAAPDQISVLAAEPWTYRNRIRLALDAHGNPGYRGRRSHAVTPVQLCPIAAPILMHAAQAFAQIRRNSASSFHPSEISLFCTADETSLLASVYAPTPARLDFDNLTSALAQQVPALVGAELLVEDRRTGASRPVAQWGASSLTYRAAGFDYRVDHGAFFQVNRRLIDPLVDAATSGYSGSLAWDLFAGVGLFARRLASHFERVVAVESAPPATAALAANLAATGGMAVRSNALSFLRKQRGKPRPDLVVVDPPRTGLGAEMTSLLADLAPAAISYVSCDPATLARDLRALAGAGYAMESVTLADLFPQTFHVETLVRLQRA